LQIVAEIIFHPEALNQAGPEAGSQLKYMVVITMSSFQAKKTSILMEDEII
jgi:hypothetical protein